MLTFVGIKREKDSTVSYFIDNTTLKLHIANDEQSINAIRNKRVVNLGLDGKAVVGTNGSLRNYAEVGKNNVPVIIKVGTKYNSKRGRDEAFEYVISSTDGKVVTYPKDKAIELFKKLGVANGRVVVREGIVPYVSAIKTKYESYSCDEVKKETFKKSNPNAEKISKKSVTASVSKNYMLLYYGEETSDILIIDIDRVTNIPNGEFKKLCGAGEVLNVGIKNGKFVGLQGDFEDYTKKDFYTIISVDTLMGIPIYYTLYNTNKSRVKLPSVCGTDNSLYVRSGNRFEDERLQPSVMSLRNSITNAHQVYDTEKGLQLVSKSNIPLLYKEFDEGNNRLGMVVGTLLRGGALLFNGYGKSNANTYFHIGVWSKGSLYFENSYNKVGYWIEFDYIYENNNCFLKGFTLYNGTYLSEDLPSMSFLNRREWHNKVKSYFRDEYYNDKLEILKNKNIRISDKRFIAPAFGEYYGNYGAYFRDVKVELVKPLTLTLKNLKGLLNVITFGGNINPLPLDESEAGVLD